MNLDQAREKIDEMDAKIVELLAKRFELCRKIGEYKKKNNLSIQDKDREKQIIKARAEKLKKLGFEEEKFVQELFELIMKKCREVQKK